MSRSAAGAALLYALLLLGLIGGSSMRAPGDGGEYLAYAMRLSDLQPASFKPEDAVSLHAVVAAAEPQLASWDVLSSAHRDIEGRLQFVHFWLYPLIASPLVAVAKAIRLNPMAGFAALHAVLLIVAFVAVHRRTDLPTTLVLLAGPIIWWIDKVHPEVLLFSLTTTALATWTEFPLISLCAASIVGAQVSPFAIALPLLVAAQIRDVPTRRYQRSYWLGVLAAFLVVALPPVYYLWRFGRPTLFVGTASLHWPHLEEITTVLWDLNVGLLPNWPWLGVLLFAACVLLRRSWCQVRPDLPVGVVLAITLLLAFPQIGNYTSGATPGILRYAVWLIPTTLPLLIAASETSAWRVVAGIVAAISVPYCLVYYHPSRPTFAYRPTNLALWVWHEHPTWSSPEPKLFATSLSPRGARLPIAGAGCNKVLLVGRGEGQGMWPRPCEPVDVPAACREPGTLCYANWKGRAYQFGPAGERPPDLNYDSHSVWPRSAEGAVRKALTLVDWRSLHPTTPAAPASMVRSVSGGRSEWLAQAEGRLMLVARGTGATLTIKLRTPASSSGVVVDGTSGAIVQPVLHDGPADKPWDLTVRSAPPIVLIVVLSSHVIP